MAYWSLKSTVTTKPYVGMKVEDLVTIAPKYLIHIHKNPNLNIYLGKSVFEALGLWDEFKDTGKCKTIFCLMK